jgi:hypothetical protein
MLRKLLPPLALLVLLLAAATVWRFARPPSPAGKSAPGATATSANAGARRDVSMDMRTPSALPVAAQLDESLARLVASNNPATNRLILADLRRTLDSLSPGVASREVQRFLSSARDAATKLDVTIEAGGGLGDASSLRVFLLDYLGRIDRSAAGAIAAQILSRETAPDEWAVSLRNYAWANPGPDGKVFLEAKARQFLNHTAWVKDPSAGFLEAFDTIVYAHGTALLPELAALVRDQENRPTSHAAYLTQLVEQPELMTGREQSRANLVARADVRVPEQRALVEKYLLDPVRQSEELAAFADSYPNANYMISNNLLTTAETPASGQLAAHDREALKTVEQWQKDPRFERLNSLLARMHKRLRNFVR